MGGDGGFCGYSLAYVIAVVAILRYLNVEIRSAIMLALWSSEFSDQDVG